MYQYVCMYTLERERVCVFTSSYKVQDRSFIGQVRKYMYFVLRVKIVGS